jgi:hypothetical protein
MIHKHHIVPRHAEPFANNCPENLIELTVVEHAEAHKQLWLMNRDPLDEIAYLTLSGQIGIEDASAMAYRAAMARIKETNSYAWLGRKHKQSSKDLQSQRKLGKDTWNKGKTGIYDDSTLSAIGTNNPRRRSIKTPYGEYESSYEFDREHGSNIGHILRYRLDSPITKHQVSKNNLFRLEHVGRTPRQLGYDYAD